jgi:RNA polymerase sigma factor (sigma-70 family)
VEGYTLRQQPLAALRGPSPLLRLASDERLIELTRSGQQAAFEALVARYHARLLAFCRHMLRSREDAEDVLQEVFAAAFKAIMADTRAINARPWLYRIARNRSLNHLRRNTAIGVDSMDAHFADQGQSTSEKAHKREEFRLLLDDIGRLPETQRSALVLREMDALSYEQIAEAMDTTVPSVKSLLVRARIGLAEAAQARKLTCGEVRVELGAAAEGIASLSAPVRRHVKDCQRCRAFRTQLRANNRALAAIFPLGPILLLKKTLLFKLGLAKFGAGSAGAGAGAASATAGGGGVAAGSAAAATGGLGSIAAGAVVVKAVAVVATVAIVAVGATKALDHHSTPPTTASGQAVAAVVRVHANAAAASPPLLAVFHHGAIGHRRHIRLVALMPRLIHPATSVAATTTPPVTSATAVATTPTQPATTPTPPAASPTSTPAASATPTTQEISTTTVFPSSGAGASPTAATGTTGATTPALGATGSTAATGATGSTGAPGTTTQPSGASGATGAGGSASPTFSQDQGGATGAGGVPGA